MKISKKLTFFFSIPFIILIILIPTVKAVDNPDGQVILNHLHPSVIPVTPTPDSYYYNDQYIDIRYSMQGIQDFYTSNLPVQEQGVDYVIFETYFTVPLVIDMFTTYDSLNDIYFNAQKKYVEFLWLTIMLDPDWGLGDANRIYRDHIVQYYDYEFTPNSQGDYIKARGFDSDFDIDFEIDDFYDRYAMSGDDRVDFSIPLIEPISGEVISSSVNPIGDYDDIFNDFGSTTLSSITISREDWTRDSEWGDANTEDTETLVESHIGMCGVSALTDPWAFTNDHAGLNLGQQGVTSCDSGILESGLIFHAKNKPNILIYEQQIRRQYGSVGIDTQGLGAGLRYTDIRPSDDPWRQIGWHINQYNLRHTIEITFKINARIDCDPTFLNELMSYPEVQRTDIIWNIALSGNTEGSVVFQESGLARFWGSLPTWVKILLGFLILVVTSVLVVIILNRAGIFQRLHDREIMKIAMGKSKSQKRGK